MNAPDRTCFPSLVRALDGDAEEEAAWLEAQLADPGTQLQAQVMRYRAPCVILGRSQAARWSMPTLHEACGMPVIARASGGGVVLAGPWMVGVSVVVPIAHPLARGGLMEAYRWLGQVHEQVMRAHGVDAWARLPESLTPRRDADPVGWMCFASLSGWEVTVEGRKLCGLAQIRRRHAVALVAGTAVQRPPWESLAAAFGCREVGTLMDERAVSCAQLGLALDASELSQALVLALQRAAAQWPGLELICNPDGDEHEPT